MSRIIVKNIPNGFDEAKVQNHFSTCGIITDVQLKYTPEGKFRNFGFIGFETEEQATKAIKHFNNTFIRTSKISVAPCVALSETKNLKVWSKHSQKPVAEAAPPGDESRQSAKNREEKPKPTTAKDVLDPRQADPMFQEFLDAHKRAGKSVWDNQFQQPDTERDSKQEPSDDEKPLERAPKGEKGGTQPAPAKKPAISLFVAKLRNIPASTKRQDLLRFFKTARPYSVRIPPKAKGFAYVGFKTESELDKALLMDKSFLGGKQVRIVNFTEQNDRGDREDGKDSDGKRAKHAKWERQRANVPSESVCESGKLFFRNLAYSVREADIRELFENYGPVVEVDVPIDAMTRKLKGFGTVTFMMPEHAVTAYSELNGTFLQGRMFHILPAKVDTDERDDESESSYKKKKEHSLKKTAQSSHNWNTLFMGENAVAEAVAKKYGTTKETVLMGPEGGTSAAVRLALGETEVVLEMQRFLQENGIQLDAFDATTSKRSSTLILAKNLPPSCTTEALRELFGKFGILGRVVLPPSGVTAIVEFLDPSEARKAFKKLAYTFFESLPLYLEWAPENTFKSDKPSGEPTGAGEGPTTPSKADATPQPVKEEAVKEQPIEEPEDDTEPEDGTTLFIKNLSFATNESAIRERFRSVGAIHSVQVVRKMDLSGGGGPSESRGYGFIQFKHRQSADHALKNLQFAHIDGRPVELARSDRTLHKPGDDGRRKGKAQKQTGSKILVRNIPFQANAKEVRDLFKPFGDIKVLRLPRKMVANAEEQHRGFGFVEFVREADAKRAFETLGRSTHLYGRRLVLEWAAAEDGVDELRKRTADHFKQQSGANGSKRKGVLDSAEFVSSTADQEPDGGGEEDDMEEEGDGAF